jgi:cell division septation protein DedD
MKLSKFFFRGWRHPKTSTSNHKKGAALPVPTGTVKLQQDGVDLPGASASLDDSGNYSVTFAGLTAGFDNITAVYSGDSNFNASTSPVLVQQVNSPLAQTTTSLASTPNPSNVGDPVVFSGAVTSV